MSERWLAFNDPFFTDEKPYCNTIRLITEEDAVQFMRRIHPENPYSDVEALDDFKAVMWAWRIEAPNLVVPEVKDE